MASDRIQASASDISKFSLIQLVITSLFLVVVFVLFGGTGEPFPPIWLVAALLLFVAVGAVLAERVWYSGPPLDSENGAAANAAEALERFAGQTVRKLIYTEVPLLVAVLGCFIFENGGWPVLIAGVPGLLVQAWETWPHLRNTSMSEAVFESQGAKAHLIENFIKR